MNLAPLFRKALRGLTSLEVASEVERDGAAGMTICALLFDPQEFVLAGCFATDFHRVAAPGVGHNEPDREFMHTFQGR